MTATSRSMPHGAIICAISVLVNGVLISVSYKYFSDRILVYLSLLNAAL